MEGANANAGDKPQEPVANPGQEGEKVAVEAQDKELDGIAETMAELNPRLGFPDEIDFDLLERGGFEFEIPDNCWYPSDDEDEADLIIDGDAYRKLLELHGEGGIEVAIGEIIKERQASLKDTAAANNPPKP